MTPARAQAAEYLHDMAEELAQIALINALPVAAHCFAMAALDTKAACAPDAIALRASETRSSRDT